MKTPDELRSKYDEMSKLWHEIESGLVSLELPHPVWVDCEYNPIDHTGLKLGFDRWGKTWRICLRDGDNDRSPLDQWGVAERVRAAKYAEELIEEARIARDTIARRVDEAIHHLEKFLANDK